jgi:Putative zincin peptidase
MIDNSLIHGINFATLLLFSLNWDIRFRIFLGDQVSSLPMRFHFGAVPSSPDFEPDVSWKSLREPSPWLAQFIALPIGVFAAALVGFLWFVITPLQKAMPTGTLSAFVLAFVGIVVVHELIHAAAHPKGGRSPHSILGFWPSRVLFYAHFDGELTRNRFVAILLMPTLVISILPLLVATIAQLSSGWLALISTSNAFAACVDLLGAGMVLFQIPATATVRNQGWRTYWREKA